MSIERPARRSRIIWAGAGVAAGFAGGLIVGLGAGGHLSAPLLGSIAACSGAIIAAAALIWNIHNGRSDRQERQAAKKQEARDRIDREERDRQAVERSVLDEAALVTVELFGGGGYGHNTGNSITGTSVSLRLINGSTKPVTRLGLQFEPHIRFKDRRALPGSLSAGEHQDLSLETHDYDLPRDQASGARLFSYRCTFTYSLGGRSWRRVEDELPTQVETDEAGRRAPLGTGS